MSSFVVYGAVFFVFWMGYLVGALITTLDSDDVCKSCAEYERFRTDLAPRSLP